MCWVLRGRTAVVIFSFLSPNISDELTYLTGIRWVHDEPHPAPSFAIIIDPAPSFTMRCHDVALSCVGRGGEEINIHVVLLYCLLVG
jgi:hypothetical protein